MKSKTEGKSNKLARVIEAEEQRNLLLHRENQMHNDNRSQEEKLKEYNKVGTIKNKDNSYP